MSYIVVSGEVSSGITINDDSMIVYDGGSATETTVNNQGVLEVSSGGAVNLTTVNGGGSLTVSEGGWAGSTTVTPGGHAYVSGGVASSANVYGHHETGNGYLDVFSGGTAISVWVNSRGQVFVHSGAVVSDTRENWMGSMFLYEGALAENTIVNTGCYLYISGGIANGLEAYGNDTYGGAYIYLSGGTVTDVTLNSIGYLYVSSGGAATSVVVNQGGRMGIGGAVTSITVSGGSMWVNPGGTASETLVSGYGSMWVYSGGTANDTVLSYGSMFIRSGGEVNSILVDYGGRLYVSDGGVVNDVRTDESGSMWIYSGGTMNNVVLSGFPYYPYWGTLNVSYGGVANSVWLKYGGYLNVSNGGLATIAFDPWRAGGINVSSGGSVIYLDSEAKVYYGSGSTISMGDYFSGLSVGQNYGVFVYSGGSVDNIGLGYWGSMYVSNGGVANGTLLGADGWYYGQLHVCSGGTANSVTMTCYGNVYVSGGGVVNSVTTLSGGYVHVSSGGTINDTTLGNTVEMYLSSGGTANRVSVTSLASMYVSNGGVADGVTVDPAAVLYFNYGATGTAIRENGGYVSAADDANVTFVSNTIIGLELCEGGGKLATVHSGTTAISAIVNHWGADLYVYSGGVAIDTLVNSGYMQVYSGGIASGATVNSSGSIRVYSGGEVADVTVNSSGYLGVYNGGTANSVRVTYYGRAYVSSAGTANDVMLGAYGSLTVNDGGTATIAYNPFGGGVVYSSAGATVTYLERDAKVYCGNWSSGVLSKADVFDNLTVNSGFSAYVFSGGVMNATTVNGYGGIAVSSGGTVNATVLNSGGWVDVYESGSASGVTVNMDCSLWIDDYATATAITENGGAVWVNPNASVTFVANTFSDLVLDDMRATVHSGTTANAITLKRYGRMYVYSGGIASATVISSAGELEVSNGGLASATTVYSSGYITVYSGGTANSVTVNSGGHVYVSRTGSVTDLDMTGDKNWYDSTCAYIYSGGVVDRATVNSGASLYFSAGASGSQITENGGYVRIEGGADVTFAANALDGMTLTWDASLHSGTTASNTVVGYDGDLHVEGGTADATTVLSGGVVELYGGTANRTTLSSGGAMAVYDGVANGVTVNSDSILYVMYGYGTVNSAVMSGGTMAVGDGGTVNSAVVYEGGSMMIVSGGKITGRVEVASGATVTVGSGAVIDFDVSTVAPGGAALCNDYSLITGAADAAHTITVSTAQLGGVYALADNAAGFDKVVTVNTDEGTELGTITVGGELVSGRTTFQLAGSATGTLALTVIAPPAMPTVSASVTTPTNRDVTLTATYSADSVTKEYSFDNSTWQNYTAGVTVAENKTVYFRAGNAAGFSDAAEFTVSNIDKVPPAKPTVTADITAPTNQSVTVTATFSTDSVVKQYSTDNATWQNYTTGLVFTANGSVYFRGTDAAGNFSEVAEFTVSNIDKVPPAMPTVSASVTTPTNGNVTVSAVFSDDSVVKEYSRDNTTWSSYTTGIVFSDNGTVYFRAADAVGNVSDVVEYAVTNIDKVAPTAPTASADITTPTDKVVTVTATFSSDSAVKEYSLDGTTWKNYTTGIAMAKNGKVYFRAADAAGNVSDVATYEVTNITADPGDKVVADITTPTNKDVTVKANFGPDSVKKEYSTDDGKTWRTYTTGVVMKENGTVRFRGSDATGKVVEVMSYDVTNIDKVPPAKPTAAENITKPTNTDVIVTAKFSADSVKKEYSTDNKTWKPYTDGVTVSRNGTVYFRATDAAGNVSDVMSYEVTNIDKTAPVKPPAAADITKTTGKDVRVTATFSDDSVKKEYSLDGKTWKNYPADGVPFAKNGTVYFRAADAAGNVSDVMRYDVKNIDNLRLAANKTTAVAKVDPMQENIHATDLDYAGFYKLTGSFGKLKKGTVTVFAKTGKKVGSGKIKNGVLTFNKGKNTLLDSSMGCTVSVKHADKKGAATEYTLRLNAVELFTKGDNTDDTLKKAKTLAAGSPVNDWVGYGDAVDYWKLGVDAQGGFYDLAISGVRNNVKLTVFAANGKKIKGVTASAKKPSLALADLCLANGSYAVIEAPKAAKALNSDYTLKLTQKATFTGMKNNDWSKAEVLEKGATFTGALTKAPGGDVVDYCDVSQIDSLTFDMTAGKTKVSFFDKNRQAVKVAEVKMANGSIKANAASLTLAAGNAATDHFTIAAIDGAVKYLKIEASGKTLNGYTITKIA